ncbi:MAG: hypothetical protein E7013_03075 [Alphaproteobacteria bacterium]|nr:hypothetical protein [Alphaproteobacteria bacterium]
MTTSSFVAIRYFLRSHIPFWFSFLLLLFGMLPWRVAFLSHFAIPFVYASLFFWTVFRPDLISAPAVFLLGLSADLLTISPLGYYTFLFLIFYWAVLLERRFLIKRPFIFLWGAFSAFVCPLVLCQWMLASLLNLKLLSLLFFMGQGALLMASYPLISILCAFLYDRYLED